MGHAAAVIHHTHQALAAGLNRHFHALRAGIQGVLHQLLDDGGGPFHHFAGGNLVRNSFGKDADYAQWELSGGRSFSSDVLVVVATYVRAERT